MELLWAPTLLPRSMSRQEWRDLYRWKRVTTKELRKRNAERIRIAIDAGRSDLLDDIIRPPLLVHPLMTPTAIGRT